MEHYIKPCAKCGRANLTIAVTTLKNAQFYTLACPRCDEMTIIDTNLERCIDIWNKQNDE